MPAPTKADSESGVSRMRSGPNSSSRPRAHGEAAAVAPDVLAHQEDARSSRQRLAQRLAQRVAVASICGASIACASLTAPALLASRRSARAPRPARACRPRRTRRRASISLVDLALERSRASASSSRPARAQPRVEARRSDRAASTARPRPSRGRAPGRTSSARGSGRCAARGSSGPPPPRTASDGAARGLLDREHVHAVDAARPAARSSPPSRARSVSDSERASAVPIAYRLFSQQNSTGSFQSAARFSDSWNSPSATAPSPKKQAVTRGRPLQLVGEREADGERQPAADDRVAAVEARRGVEDVHRAAAAAAAALGFAVHLGHASRACDARARARGRARGRWRRSRRPARAPASRRRRPPPRRCRGAGSRGSCSRCRARRTSPRSGGCAASRAAARVRVAQRARSARSRGRLQRREVALGQPELARLAAAAA